MTGREGSPPSGCRPLGEGLEQSDLQAERSVGPRWGGSRHGGGGSGAR